MSMSVIVNISLRRTLSPGSILDCHLKAAIVSGLGVNASNS